jgi:iron complex transport system substrate-binding protein
MRRFWRAACVGFAAALCAAAAVAAPGAQRIVSLSPALTETVCALGACARLVGTDGFSNWPAAAQALPKLGGLEDLQVERVVALKPDLVLATTSMRALDRLRALGLRVVTLEPRSMAELRVMFADVASLLGDPAAGPALWRDMQSRLQATAAAVPVAWRGRSVYFEIASTPYAAGEASFIGEVLAALGLRNIVGAELGAFPQLSPEWVVKRAPQLMLGTAQAVREMPQRPGWGSLPALRSGQICGFDAPAVDMLMRAGPRLSDAAEAVLRCLQSLQVPALAMR